MRSEPPAIQRIRRAISRSHVPDTQGNHPANTVSRPETRRHLLRRVAGAMTVTVGGVAGYGALYAPFHPVVERVNVVLPRLPEALDGLRVAVLSDLHIQTAFPPENLKPAFALVAKEKPDLILLVGDYVFDQEEDKFEWMLRCAASLKALSAPLGVYASFGNHDFPPPPDDPPFTPFLEAGVQPLCHSFAEVVYNKTPFYLVGMRSAIQRPVAPEDVFAMTPPNSPKIVLWHEPDRAMECARLGVVLQVSGHTHGGQVRLPLIGAPLLPIGGKLFPAGLFQLGKMGLYVTRGLGVLPPRVRINCPPEVTLLTLRSLPTGQKEQS